MGLYASFDVQEAGFIEATPIYNIFPDYGPGCEIFVQTFIETAQSLCPVDTGYLRSTITASSTGTGCEAEASCEYAQYQEYGTWCMPAQPYFGPALEAAMSAAWDSWTEAEELAQEEEEELLEEEALAGRGPSKIGGRISSAQRAGMLQSMRGMSFTGALLTAFLVGIVRGIVAGIKEAFRTNEKGSGRNRGGGGNASFFIPDVIIT